MGRHEPLDYPSDLSQHQRAAGPISNASTSSAPIHHRIMSDFGSDDSSGPVVEFDTRIKHYFGWTVNASAGTESISSEDSNAFWNAYSLSLAKAVSFSSSQQAIIRKHGTLKLLIFCLFYS